MTAFDGRELKVDYPKYVSRFGVVYETPPTRGCDGPVMGNGDLGAVVFFPRRNLLRLVLNKTDAWVGHDLRTVLALEYELDGVDVKDAVTRLHIEDARIVSEFRGDGWSRKVVMFIDALSNRLIIRSQGSVPDDARATIRLGKDWGEGLTEVTLEEKRYLTSKDVDDGTIHIAAAFESSALEAQISGEGAHRWVTWTLPQADDLLFALGAHTGGAKNRAIEDVTAALDAGYERILASHRVWWREFWSESFVEIDEGTPPYYYYLTHLYYLNLYTYACSFRGDWVPPFEGGLWTWDQDRRLWVIPGRNYWHWNQTAAIIGLPGCGHPELMQPYLKTFFGMLDEARKAAKTYFDLPGAVFHEVHRRDGCEPSHPNLDRPDMMALLSPGPQMATLFYDHYRYTQDEAFLRDKAYPLMRDVVEFLLAYATADEDGRLHFRPSSPYEHGKRRGPLHDATQLIFSLKACLTYLLETDEVLHLADPEERKRWQDALQSVAEPPTWETPHGIAFAEALDENGKPVDAGMQFTPEFGGVYPLMLIDPDSPDFQVARNTYRDIMSRQFNFPFTTGALVAARLGLGEEVYNVLGRELALQFYPNGLFSYVVARSFGDHPERAENCYLESSGLFMATIQESLLQSHGGIVRVFPAVSVSWESRFKLNARGGFVVSSEKRWNEPPPFVLVESRAGMPFRLFNPWPEVEVKVTLVGDEQKQVPFARRDACIEFLTKSGERYLIEPADEPRKKNETEEISGEPPEGPCFPGPHIGLP